MSVRLMLEVVSVIIRPTLEGWLYNTVIHGPHGPAHTHTLIVERIRELPRDDEDDNMRNDKFEQLFGHRDAARDPIDVDADPKAGGGSEQDAHDENDG